jgi:hypothetical protein
MPKNQMCDEEAAQEMRKAFPGLERKRFARTGKLGKASLLEAPGNHHDPGRR